MMKTNVFFIIGVIFSPIAGISAFIVSFEEYKHHYTNTKDTIKIPLLTAFIAFLVFLSIFSILSFYIP